MPSTITDRVDGLTTSVAVKAPCRVATTANITLSGLQTIDGVTVQAGDTSTGLLPDRVLVKNQTTSSANGIYTVSSTAWARAKDFDGARDVVTGSLVYVRAGTTNSGTFWSVSTADPITIGTSNITWTQTNNQLAGITAFVATLLDDTTAAAFMTTLGISSFVQTVLDDTTAANARTTLGAAASGANGDITSLTALASINGGQTGGFRNLLINGGMEVWQRGTSFTPSAATVTYAADRWCTLRASANYTVSQQANPLAGFNNGIRVQRNNANAALDVMYLSQSLSSNDSIKLQGQAATLTFYAKCGASYSSAGSALNVQGGAGTGTDQNALTGYTGSAGAFSQNVTLTTSYQRFTVAIATLPSNLNEFGFLFSSTPVGTAGANDWYEVTGAQLEIGSVATAFEYRNFVTELTQCQRFYEKSFELATVPAQNAGAGSGESIGMAGKAGALTELIYVAFKVRKRTDPTIVTYNPAAANAQVRDETAAADCSAISVAMVKETGMAITATGNASTAVGNTLGIHWTATAEL